MPYEISNSLRTKSTIRIVGTGNTRVNLSQLVASSAETVQSADIAQVSGVTDGTWKVYRGNDATGVLVLELPAFSHFIFSDIDTSLSNNSTSNVFVTNSGNVGTLMIQMSKSSTFNPPQTGL